MKKRILTVIPFLVIGVLLLVFWTFTVQAQEPGEEPVTGPETEGPPPGATIIQVGQPTPPPPPRGQRPLLPSDGEIAAMEKAAVMTVFDSPNNMGGPFANSYFFDDVESGTGQWTATGLWHDVDDSDTYGNSYSATHSWWFGQDSTGDYDTGAQVSGALQTQNPIAIPAAAPAVWLRFWSWEMTEDLDYQWDTRRVYFSTDGGASWMWSYQSIESYGQWRMHLVNLSDYGVFPGDSLLIRFEFDSIDETYNGYRGWYLDDIAVGYDPIQVAADTDDRPWPSYQTDPYIMYGIPGAQSYLRNLHLWNYTGVDSSFTTTVTSDWTVWGWPLPLEWDGYGMGWISPGDYEEKGSPFYVEIPPDAVMGAYKDVTMVSTSPLFPGLENTTTVRVYATGGVHYESHQIIDDGSGQSQGNGDGKLDAGERIELEVTLKNDTGQLREGVQTWIWDNMGMQWINSWQNYGDMADGATATAKYLFDVSGGRVWSSGTEIEFYIDIMDWGQWWGTHTFTETLGAPAMPTSARAGASSVHHRFWVQNQTGVETVFEIDVPDNTWLTTIDPAITASLCGWGCMAPFTVTVDIPPDATPGDEDGATLEVHAVTPDIYAYGHITTTKMSTDWVQIYGDNSRPPGWPLEEYSDTYLAVIQSMDQWRLSTDDNEVRDPAVTAFRYDDTVAYAWAERRDALGGQRIGEVVFGARRMDGTPVIPSTRVADHFSDTTVEPWSGEGIRDENPSIAWVPINGNIVVAWSRRHKIGHDWGNDIYYAVYSDDGTPLVPPTNVTNNTTGQFQDQNPAVEAFRNGGKVALVWQRWDWFGISDLVCVILDANGNVIQLPTGLGITGLGIGGGNEPVLTQIHTADELLLTWRTDQANYALLNSGGTISGKTELSKGGGAPNGPPDAVALPDEHVVLGWSWNDQSTGQNLILYSVLSSDYNVQVPPTVLDNPWSTDNRNVSVVGDASGNAVLTWQGQDWMGNLWYAWLSSGGTVLTPPRMYWTSPNSWAFCGWRGQSNGGMVPSELLALELSIGKSDFPDPVAPGSLLTYTITVTETDGLADATGVKVTDTVPANTTFASSPDGTFDGNDVVWTDQTVLRGSSLDLTFVVMVEQVPNGTIITNDAYRVVSSDQGVTTSLGSAVDTLVAAPELSIGKSAIPGMVTPGDLLTYTITVTETDGLADATGVKVTDTVPVSTTCCASISQGGKWNGKDMEWSNLVITKGERIALTFAVWVTRAPTGTIITNDAYRVVSSDQGVTTGLGSAVNTPVFTVAVPVPSLFISKSDFPDPVLPGDLLTYTINVAEMGGVADATGVQVTDTVPANTTFAFSSDGWQLGNDVGWWVPIINKGQSISLTFAVWVNQVPTGTIITNDAYRVVTSAQGVNTGLGSAVNTAVFGEAGAETGVVDPGVGGTVDYTDPNGLTTSIEVPGGAVTDTTIIQYTPQVSPTVGVGGFLFAGHAFEIEAFVNGVLQPGFVFIKPVTITIHYTDADVAGMNESMLMLYTWDDSTSSWVPVETCGAGYIRDPANNVIQVQICHLSEFALFGETPTIRLPLILKEQ